MGHNDCSSSTRNEDGSACMYRLLNNVDVCKRCDKANQVAHLNCVQCHPILMYPYGAPRVKCAICNYIANAGMHNMRFPIHVAHRPNEPTPVPPSTSVVSNVVVGVTTGKK